MKILNQKPKVGLIDFGAGNLSSLKRVLRWFNIEFIVSNKQSELETCSHLVLPGVGAFDHAMMNMKSSNLDEFCVEWIDKNQPFLGICIGFHLLCTKSSEGSLNGLGIFNYKVEDLSQYDFERVPHMGWARPTSNPAKFRNSSYYFCHSFGVVRTSNECAAGTNTVYLHDLIIADKYKNCLAVQFHPERSGETGQELIGVFLNV